MVMVLVSITILVIVKLDILVTIVKLQFVTLFHQPTMLSVTMETEPVLPKILVLVMPIGLD